MGYNNNDRMLYQTFFARGYFPIHNNTIICDMLMARRTKHGTNVCFLRALNSKCTH